MSEKNDDSIPITMKNESNDPASTQNNDNVNNNNNSDIVSNKDTTGNLGTSTDVSNVGIALGESKIISTTQIPTVVPTMIMTNTEIEISTGTSRSDNTMNFIINPEEQQKQQQQQQQQQQHISDEPVKSNNDNCNKNDDEVKKDLETHCQNDIIPNTSIEIPPSSIDLLDNDINSTIQESLETNIPLQQQQQQQQQQQRSVQLVAANDEVLLNGDYPKEYPDKQEPTIPLLAVDQQDVVHNSDIESSPLIDLSTVVSVSTEQTKSMDNSIITNLSIPVAVQDLVQVPIISVPLSSNGHTDTLNKMDLVPKISNNGTESPILQEQQIQQPGQKQQPAELQQEQQQEQQPSSLHHELQQHLANETEQQQQQQTQSQSQPDSLLVEIQMELSSQLQNEKKLRLEMENKYKELETRMIEITKNSNKQVSELQQLQITNQQSTTTIQVLQKERDDANTTTILLQQRVQDLERETMKQKYEIEEHVKNYAKLNVQCNKQEKEIQQIQKELVQQEQYQMSATSRLSTSRKSEQEQLTLACKYKDQLTSTKNECDQYKNEVQALKSTNKKLEHKIQSIKDASTKQIHKLFTLVKEQKQVNLDRKHKIKSYIQNKIEEIRIAKDDNELLQIELARTNKLIIDWNNRYTTIHNQYMITQSRNREMQRDINRIKKDSENLSQVGTTLEKNLYKVQNETEEHKNKRLAAKHELITVLSTLQNERHITNQIKDRIKYTITPNIINHTQSLDNCLQLLERQLFQLSIRLGHTNHQSQQSQQQQDNHDNRNNNNENGTSTNQTDTMLISNNNNNNNNNTSEVDVAVTKIEYETQRVSTTIQKLQKLLDTLCQLVNDSGERTCYTVIQDLVISSTGIRLPVLVSSSSSSISNSTSTSAITNGTNRGGIELSNIASSSVANNGTTNNPARRINLSVPIPQRHRYGHVGNTDSLE